MNTARYGADALPATPRKALMDELTADPGWAASVLETDRLVRAFPHFDTLVVTYARVSRFIEESGIDIPPLPE